MALVSELGLLNKAGPEIKVLVIITVTIMIFSSDPFFLSCNGHNMIFILNV